MRRIETQLKAGLIPLKKLSWVAHVRVLGAIGVVELNNPVDMAGIQRQFVKRGVWIRPFGKLVYTMPPYIIDPSQLARVIEAMVEVMGLEGAE